MLDNAGIDARTSVREVMRRFPRTREIFDPRGLLGCGGPEGPMEPIAVFARVHQMDTDELLAQLRRAAAAEAPAAAMSQAPQRAAVPAPAQDDRIWPRIFVRTAALSFIAVGALTGALYLAVISRYGTFEIAKFWPDWTAHIQSHGHVQLSGWVTLSIMGIAYFALPRFLAPTYPQTSSPQACYWLMLSGIVLRILYQPFSTERWAANMVVWGAIAEFAAAIVFLRFILHTVGSSPKKQEPYAQYVKWGAVWLLVSQAILLVHAAAALVQQREVILSRPIDEAYLHTFLMGFTSLFILGVTLRTIPLMLNFSKVAGARAQRTVLAIWNIGVLSFAAGQVARAWKPSSGSSWILAGACLELIAGAAFLIAANPFQRPQASLDDGSPHEWLSLVRAAYFWFALALAMEAALAAWLATTGVAPAQPYWGAFRHSLTVGWVSMMIFGMAYRMIPVMEGQTLCMAWTASVVLWLANAGALGRVGLQSLGVTVPGAVRWMAPTGFMELTAGILFTLSIWKTASKPKMISEPRGQGEQLLPGHIHADNIVGDVLNAIPESLDVFVRHGFTALKNPALRAAAASMVSIAQACRMHGVSLDVLLAELNALPDREPTPPEAKAAPASLVQLAPASKKPRIQTT